MKACEILFAFSIHLLFTACATGSEKSREIPRASDEIDAAETYKTELTPLFISAGLSDIIVLSAPIINNTNTIYYLYNPNGDSIKLDINTSRITTDFKKTSGSKSNDYYQNVPKHEGKVKTIIPTTKKRKIKYINRENNENNCLASYSDFEKQPNDFTMGPITEDDHGNWVLSLYYKGNDGNLQELFQVITIHIVESYPTYAPKTKLVPGQTFEPRFLYPIINLQSCEIRAPRTAFDRFYDRDRFNTDSCGFRIPNVTKDDEGLWRILGVGKIVHEGEVYLQIDDDVTV